MEKPSIIKLSATIISDFQKCCDFPVSTNYLQEIKNMGFGVKYSNNYVNFRQISCPPGFLLPCL